MKVFVLKLPMSSNGKQTLLLSLLVAAVAFLLYASSLGYGFVSDDNYQILLNFWIRSFRYIPDMFTKNSWAYETLSSNYYRPLMHLAYMAVYMLAGEKAWAFHLLNVLSNCAASVMAFLLASRLFGRYKTVSAGQSVLPALFAGLLFAAHPVHTEAVDWIASFPETSCAFFYFLSVYFYLGRNGRKRGVELAASLLFFSLAALSKETGLTLPIAIFMLDIALNERPWKARLKNYALFAAVSIAYLAIRFYAVGMVNRRDLGLTGPQLALNSIVNFSMYLAKLILPVNLNAYIVFHPVLSFSAPKALFSILLTLAFMAAAVFSWKKRKLVFIGIALVFIPLAPVLYLPVFFKSITFAERYLYLPSFGFALAFSDLAFAGFSRPANSRRLLKMASGALSVVVALYCAGVILRNPAWKSDYTLASVTLGQSPDSAAMHNELGMSLQARRMPDEAIQQYMAALSLDPELIEPVYNIGTCYAMKGETGQAVNWFKKAVAKNPYYVDAHEQLGMIYLNKGLLDPAIYEFAVTVKLNPELAGDHNNLGLALLRKGLFAKAGQEFRIASILSPSSATPRTNMGLAYLEMGKPDEAARQFEAALKLNPRAAAEYQGLAEAYIKLGMKDKAAQYLGTALRLSPANAGIRKDLAALESSK